MGLDLSSIQADVATTAIGRVAHETMEGETSLAPDETSLRFGREMAIIDANNPGRSYLVLQAPRASVGRRERSHPSGAGGR